MSSLVKWIVFAFSLFYVIGMIIMPEVFFPGLGVLLILTPFGGLIWLIFRRCKFTLGQLWVSLLLFGFAMSLPGAFFNPVNPIIYIPLAILLVPLVGLGMFLGARAAMKSNPRSQRRRWIYFLSGLLLPSTTLAALYLLANSREIPSGKEFGCAGLLLSGISLGIIIHCIGRKSAMLKEPERIVPKICPDRL